MSEQIEKESTKAQEIETLYRRYSTKGIRRQRMRRFLQSCSWIFIIQPLVGAKRLFDLLLSLLLALIFSPVLIFGYLMTGSKLKRTTRLGQWCKTFEEYSFETEGHWGGKIIALLHLQKLPALLNIIKGEMSFVGPRPVSPGELSPSERNVRKRYNVRPGLLSLWWIRRRANIDYGTELDADLEYVETQGVLGDIGITLRAIPAILYGQGVPSAPERVTLLGIPISNVTMSEAIDEIMERLERDSPSQVCFVNADCANIAYRNKEYLEVLQKADLCLADGIGLKLAGKLLAQEIRQNVNGTDMFPMLCEALAGSGKGLFLLGARPGVAEAVAEWVSANYPGAEVKGFQHGYFKPEEEPAVIEAVRSSGAHLLLVAFGAPKQDIWIHQHLKETGVKVGMGVGGLFDFYSGRMPRAPLWMREMGMEWVYRLIQEPGRLWKRYLIGNGLFLFRVLWERMTSKRSADDGF